MRDLIIGIIIIAGAAATILISSLVFIEQIAENMKVDKVDYALQEQVEVCLRMLEQGDLTHESQHKVCAYKIREIIGK